MGKPAARVGDMHTCPMVTPGLPPVPHVGGPIVGPGVPTVLIGGMPAAVMGDMCTCVGPPDTIIFGSIGVLVGGKPIARVADNCAHGGVTSVGMPSVLIGESGSGGTSFSPPKPGFFENVVGFFKKLFNIESVVPTTWQIDNAVSNIQALAEARLLLASKKTELLRWNVADKQNVKIWMGDDLEQTRRMLLDRLDKTSKSLDNMNPENFKQGPKPAGWTDEDWNATYAYVYPTDNTHTIHVGPVYESASTAGSDSKADTVVHETSHFTDVDSTTDEPMDPSDPDPNREIAYGQDNCKELAKNDPNRAQQNADNFTYYVSN